MSIEGPSLCGFAVAVFHPIPLLRTVLGAQAGSRPSSERPALELLFCPQLLIH